MMTLRDRLLRAARQYGEAGTQTLEYIGLVIREGLVTDKVYQTLPSPPVEQSDWKTRLWEQWFVRLHDRFPMKICDTSQGGTADAPTYRMIVMFKKPLTEEQLHALTAELYPEVAPEIMERCFRYCGIIRTALEMPHAPLIQIGIEVDAAFQFRCMKYYITVKQSGTEHQRITRSLTELVGTLQGTAPSEETFRLLTGIQDCRYSPTFIGINDSCEVQEAKLYFISDLFGRALRTAPAEQAREVSEVLSLDPALRETLLSVWKQAHLYPEGVAVSFGAQPLLRLYLKELWSRHFPRSNG